MPVGVRNGMNSSTKKVIKVTFYIMKIKLSNNELLLYIQSWVNKIKNLNHFLFLFILRMSATNLEEHSGTDSCLYLLVVWHLYTDTRQLLETSFEVAENCKVVVFLSELHNIMSSL